MISLSTLRARWVGLLGAVVALVLGVALIAVTALVIAATVARPVTPRLFAATDAVLKGATTVGTSGKEQRPADEDDDPVRLDRAAPLPASTAATVASLPGVAAVRVDRTTYAQLLGRDGAVVPDPREPVVRPWSIAAAAPYSLRSGRAPLDRHEVVVDSALAATAGVAPGDTVSILASGGVSTWRVSGIAAGAPLQAALFVSDEAAARTPVDAVTFDIAPGADPATVVAAVARAVPGGEVLVGDDRGRVDSDPDATLLEGTAAIMGTVAAIAGFVSIFVVAATFTFAVLQRRREFAVLRSIGASAAQVRRMVLGEALAVAVVAALCGDAIGVALSGPVARALTAVGFAPAGFTVTVSWAALIIAAGVGVAVALLGAFAAARRAGRVHPAEALREAAVEVRLMSPARWAFAVLAAAGTVVLAVIGPRLGGPDAIGLSVLTMELAVVAAGLLGPVLIPPVVAVLTLPFSRSTGATGLLVRQNALGNVRRTATTAGPVMVTIALVAGLFGLTGTSQSAMTQADRTRLVAEHVVLPAGTPGITVAAIDRMRESPRSVVSALFTTTLVQADRSGEGAVPATGVDPTTLPRLVDLTVRSGSLADLTGESVAVASSTGRAVGDVMPVYLDGPTPRPLRVVAVVDGPPVLSSVLLPSTLLTTAGAAELADVVLADGDPAELARRAGPGTSLSSVSDWLLTRDLASARINRVALIALLGMAVLYTGIAIANTLVMSIGERGREFAVLRLGGATVGQVALAVVAEAVLVVAIGVVLAAVLTGLTLLGVTSTLAGVLDVAVTPVVPWDVIGPLIVAVSVLALVASLIPALLMMRSRPVELAGARE